MIRTKTTEKSLSQLITELDGHFSRWIRKRDTVDGKVICFICGKRMDFQEAECGHWIHRAKMPTRYDEKNCHALCHDCNVMDELHPELYLGRMIVRYSTDDLVYLTRKSNGLQKFHRFELEYLINFYKSENRLRK